jgi:hypothetical protein
MADGLWRPAGTRVRRTFAQDFRGPSQASACWQAYNVREGVIDNTKLTPYRGLDEVLIDYAHTSRAVLGDNFVGLYLLGSLAIGDFDLTSDVDFMIVANSELGHDQVELVQFAHTKLIAWDSRWVRHLEYSIFPRQKLSEKSSPYGPNGRDDSVARQLWYFNNGGSAIERSDHDNTLVTRWTLRYRSKAVLGPEPAAFAPEVTSDELRQEIRNSMLGWEKLFTPDSPYNNRFHQVFFVLNNCRAARPSRGQDHLQARRCEVGQTTPRCSVARAHRLLLAGAAGHRNQCVTTSGSSSFPADRCLHRIHNTPR